MSCCDPDPSNALFIVDPTHLDCVLAAGDASDLTPLKAWLRGLPEESYGRVFIEVFAPMQVEELPAPRHVGITWICRESLRPSPRPGIGLPRGAALARAVDAWLDEWLRVDEPPSRHLSIWAGAQTSSIMQSLWCRVGQEIDRLSQK